MADEESTEGTEEKDARAAAPAAAAQASAATPKETVDPARAAAKAEIHALKAKRAGVIEAKDGVALKKIRRKIRNLKRQLRKAAAA
ncbi:MAG: hypothetical protein E4H03_05200 [Myxococcales bacterium]|nr:MAG: hypothetical protein E4H03_05200 [Myxococcales bacterium]